MSPADVETCSKCGRLLPPSQQACVFRGMIVCEECDKALRSRQTPQPAPSPKAAVSAETVTSPFSPAPTQTKAKVSKDSGNPGNEGKRAIFEAISKNDTVTIQSLLNSWPKLINVKFNEVNWNDGMDKRNNNKWDPTPLHYAAYYGYPRPVEILIAKGADVNSRNSDGDTPLHILGSMGYDDQLESAEPHRVAELLLDNGAAVNAKNKSGKTPLHYAVQAPHRWKTVDLLLGHGANAKAKDNEGVTPLHDAVLDGGFARPEDMKRVLSSLLAAGADINAGTVAGATQTPLNWALQEVERWRGKDEPDFQRAYTGALAIVEFFEAQGASDGYRPDQLVKAGMTCSEHPGARAVTMCSNKCGRALCVNCANAFKPPTCSGCANAINSEIAAASAQERRMLIRRIIVNVLFLIPYIVVLSSRAAGGKPSEGTLWVLLPILIWGFIGFRWLLKAFTSVTGLVIFARLRSWGWTFLFGSLVCGAFGFIIIPILIVLQSIQLYRIRGNNKAIKTVAVGIPVLSMAALIIASQVHFGILGRSVAIGGGVDIPVKTNNAKHSGVTSGNRNYAANREKPVVPQPMPSVIEPRLRRPLASSTVTAEIKETIALPQYDWGTSGLTHSYYRNEKAGLCWWLEKELKENPKLKKTLEGLAEVIHRQADGCGTTIYEYSQKGENLWAAGAYTTTHKWASGEKYRSAKEEEKKGTSRGFICYSADNGKSWVRQWFSGSSGPDPVYGIYFSDLREGWALSSKGILHTNNSGSSWERILECNEDISNLFILSKTNLLVTEARPFLHVYSSGDRGVTWDKTNATPARKQEVDDLQRSFGVTVHYGGIYSKEESHNE